MARPPSPVTTQITHTESACVWDLSAAVDDKTTPVTITVYKAEKRVR